MGTAAQVGGDRVTGTELNYDNIKRCRRHGRRGTMTLGSAYEYRQGCSPNVKTVDNVDIRNSYTDMWADYTACEYSVHECDECEAELGTLYIETQVDVAMEASMAREWALLDSMYIRNFLEAERAAAYVDPRALAACSRVG
jgi:hypothetical protein